MRTPNPYRPGFNQVPAVLAGRDPVIAGVQEALDVAALDARTPRPLVLTGGRGLGKTVLLSESAVIAADQRSWLTVPIEIRPNRPFTPQLVERLTVVRDLYHETPKGKRVQVTGAKVRAHVLGVGGELSLTRTPLGPTEPAAPLDDALSDAMDAAVTKDAGLLLTLDELQSADRAELADLAAVLQEHVPDSWPLVVIVAGLPGIRDKHRRVTYLERGEWHVLDLLDPAATRRAIAEPARSAGRPMTEPAARLLAESSGGYPYAVQVMGHHAWRASARSDAIELRHARTAVDAAERDLADGLYASRWADASPKEREYLAALAGLLVEGAATGGDVARALGKRPAEVSYLRERLVTKGTIFSGPGGLRFAVPGLAEWVRARHRY